ncbi:hypothetical protein [Pseudomonas asiatica]|uniref:Uncharacterized protein n=1 Tax=Pseudomonas asiatica TaxID=2219225 RepID=A0A9X4HTW7_9PSED|nr:hypothetical protein [Pseudomonas asiatica]MDD2108996.1 hypothetical protein [Pseudomonas asiatica]
MEINWDDSMKITSQQKKLGLPLSGLIASFLLYLEALGTVWAILLVVPMVGFLMAFLIFNGEHLAKRIKSWFERDGW